MFLLHFAHPLPLPSGSLNSTVRFLGFVIDLTFSNLFFVSLYCTYKWHQSIFLPLTYFAYSLPVPSMLSKMARVYNFKSWVLFHMCIYYVILPTHLSLGSQVFPPITLLLKILQWTQEYIDPFELVLLFFFGKTIFKKKYKIHHVRMRLNTKLEKHCIRAVCEE